MGHDYSTPELDGMRARLSDLELARRAYEEIKDLALTEDEAVGVIAEVFELRPEDVRLFVLGAL